MWVDLLCLWHGVEEKCKYTAKINCASWCHAPLFKSRCSELETNGVMFPHSIIWNKLKSRCMMDYWFDCGSFERLWFYSYGHSFDFLICFRRHLSYWMVLCSACFCVDYSAFLFWLRRRHIGSVYSMLNIFATWHQQGDPASIAYLISDLIRSVEVQTVPEE